MTRGVLTTRAIRLIAVLALLRFDSSVVPLVAQHVASLFEAFRLMLAVLALPAALWALAPWIARAAGHPDQLLGDVASDLRALLDAGFALAGLWLAALALVTLSQSLGTVLLAQLHSLPPLQAAALRIVWAAIAVQFLAGIGIFLGGGTVRKLLSAARSY